MSIETEGLGIHRAKVTSSQFQASEGKKPRWIDTKMRAGARSIFEVNPSLSHQQNARIDTHDQPSLSALKLSQEGILNGFSDIELDEGLRGVQRILSKIMKDGTKIAGPIVEDMRGFLYDLRLGMNHDIDLTENPLHKLKKKGIYKAAYAGYQSQAEERPVSPVPNPFFTETPVEDPAYHRMPDQTDMTYYEKLDSTIELALGSSPQISRDGFSVDDRDMFVDTLYEAWDRIAAEVDLHLRPILQERFNGWIEAYRESADVQQVSSIKEAISNASPAKWRTVRALAQATERKVKVEPSLRLDPENIDDSLEASSGYLSKSFDSQTTTALEERLRKVIHECEERGIQITKPNVKKLWVKSEEINDAAAINQAFEAWYKGKKISSGKIGGTVSRVASGVADSILLKGMGDEVKAGAELIGASKVDNTTSRKSIKRVSEVLEERYDLDAEMLRRLNSNPDLMANLAKSIGQSVPFYGQRTYTGWPMYAALWGLYEKIPQIDEIIGNHTAESVALSTAFAISMSAWKGISQKVRLEERKFSPDLFATLGYTVSSLDRPESERHAKVGAVTGIAADNLIWGFSPASLALAASLGPTSVTAFISSLGLNYGIEKVILKYPDIGKRIAREIKLTERKKVKKLDSTSLGNEFDIGDGIHFSNQEYEVVLPTVEGKEERLKALFKAHYEDNGYFATDGKIITHKKRSTRVKPPQAPQLDDSEFAHAD